MPRVSAFPYSKMDSELKAIVHAADEALDGSQFVQAAEAITRFEGRFAATISPLKEWLRSALPRD